MRLFSWMANIRGRQTIPQSCSSFVMLVLYLGDDFFIMRPFSCLDYRERKHYNLFQKKCVAVVWRCVRHGTIMPKTAPRTVHIIMQHSSEMCVATPDKLFPGPVFSYKLRYIVGFWLVEMAISTNQKPTIYRNLYENTGPVVQSYPNRLFD